MLICHVYGDIIILIIMIMKTTITSFSEGNSEKTVNTVVALSIYLIV